jgi:hypothetical protein
VFGLLVEELIQSQIMSSVSRVYRGLVAKPAFNWNFVPEAL